VALSLALAQPRRVLPAAFMATDAKFWVAAGPILDASRCLALAGAGGRGIDDLVEVHGGLLDQLAAVPLPGVFSGWGERWHLRTLSIKAVPGCAYLTAAVEAASSLAPMDLREVESVEVGASIFTLGMEAESAPYMRRAQSPLPALGFSVGYNVAAALESGGLDVDDLHGEPLASDERWEVAGRLRLVHDIDLTVRALSATAPIGAALGRAGESARAWLLSRGATEEMVDRVLAAAAGDEDFENPSKRLGARLRVRLRDGRLLEADRDAARGCCQESVADRLDLAEAKFLAQARPRIGARAEEGVDSARRYEEMTAAELRRWRGPRLHPAVSGHVG
jgi:2-methylcitrate dehydratase PrpD